MNEIENSNSDALKVKDDAQNKKPRGRPLSKKDIDKMTVKNIIPGKNEFHVGAVIINYGEKYTLSEQNLNDENFMKQIKHAIHLKLVMLM